MPKDKEVLVVDQEKLCLTPDCGKEGVWKGLCRSCYGQALRLIESGKTNWEELQEMGLAAMSSKPFAVAFQRKKQAAEAVKEQEAQQQERLLFKKDA